ncbi:MAG: NADH pyrophosphatase [Bacteroidales bacterium 45-6]|nr:MAG: NADH pyrophosphatase [Bacteroidales bacterium 45-6]
MIQDIFPHHFNNQFLADRAIEANDYVLHFRDNKLLMKTAGSELELPRKKDFPEINGDAEATFLFTLDDVSCFMLWNDLPTDEAVFDYKEIGFFRTFPQPETAWISLVGFHLQHWYEEHRFCGKCGAKTKHKEDERAVFCSECGTLFFPKISPAIIVAITAGGKILLANNANFRPGWFSLIAGYVDVGETLEETVLREVKEEVGLDVKNIRYFASQPWPLSGSLMVGFTAEADQSQPIKIDGKEITEAAWFERGNLPSRPTNISIAGEMLDKFEKGEL